MAKAGDCAGLPAFAPLPVLLCGQETMAATLKATTMLGAAVSGARPSGLKAALPIRRRAGVVRVANIAAPAEELLGNQPQSTQPRFEVRWLLLAWLSQFWVVQCIKGRETRPKPPSYGRGWCCQRAAAGYRRHRLALAPSIPSVPSLHRYNMCPPLDSKFL